MYSFLFIKKNSMVTTQGFAHTIWLIVLCFVPYVTLSCENGVEKTTVGNLTIGVYNLSSLNCTWKTGRHTSKDTQYFLYLQNRKGEQRECPYYTSNEDGQHVACHFPHVTINADKVALYLKVLINKSRTEFYNKTDVVLYEYERLGPPQNITVNCSSGHPSECRVQWMYPPHSRNLPSAALSGCFEYAIKDETRNTTTCTTKEYYICSGDVKHTLKLRARGGKYCPISKMSGEWSDPIVFGTEPNRFPTLPFVCAVLGTIITILLLVFLCKRYNIWQTLAAPIPQPKIILYQDEKNMEKAYLDPVATADEKITVFEVITDSCKKA
ncbi:granulocyte-macrophage colony-stimulating factor receptor subunit alpha-like [Hemicordylus capensis]|uniref:granulocyte-macrophage colony-stimulating factor receptor subunit alpha-like n=1 Tax=Hemicordylus capensis TaxID=884348 RepID=UPI002303795D|nr:granulocyte-macrophage colony-stimulating factor receptor subunit alpha-like [Hemicordylus capensis]XP_053161208.1 granulocyte-macrophage colony-stimulating factor receptor subunit alpha-like [Hemicordylus capensis]